MVGTPRDMTLIIAGFFAQNLPAKAVELMSNGDGVSSKSRSPPLRHREVGFLPLSLLSRMEGAVLAKFRQKFSKKFSNGTMSRWKKKIWYFEQHKAV